MAFEVQATTDLEQWTPVTTVINLAGMLGYGPDAADHLWRFYRTLLR
jgi:hypothetical protein